MLSLGPGGKIRSVSPPRNGRTNDNTTSTTLQQLVTNESEQEDDTNEPILSGSSIEVRFLPGTSSGRSLSPVPPSSQQQQQQKNNEPKTSFFKRRGSNNNSVPTKKKNLATFDPPQIVTSHSIEMVGSTGNNDNTSITVDERHFPSDQPVDLDVLLSEYEKHYKSGRTALDDDDADLFTQAQVNMEPINTSSNFINNNSNNPGGHYHTNRGSNNNNRGSMNNTNKSNMINVTTAGRGTHSSPGYINNKGVGFVNNGNNSNNNNGTNYDEDDEEEAILEQLLNSGNGKRGSQFYSNPNQRLLDNDASLIPGSPFSKPAHRLSKRPAEPLTIAKTSSTLSLLLTIAWVGFLFFQSIWTYNAQVGRIIIEILLSLISFLGIFWNTYFSISSIMKCFIPRKAFVTNTKYCSIIPETKDPKDDWLDVTIQIPVYKESLQDVIMPTLRSCVKAREHYIQQTNNTATCNIVICDDGMMSFLHNNFAAAAMLWETIQNTSGKEYKLGRLLKMNVPRASRMHLKGLRSKNVYEVFYRMLFYYHYNIGWVARSTIDRRGKFKKASNLNSHLRLAFGAQQSMSSHNNNNNQQNHNGNKNSSTDLLGNTLLSIEDSTTVGLGGNNNNNNNNNGGGLLMDNNNNNKNNNMPSGGSVLTFDDALLRESHNDDGSRSIMFGNNIKIGDVIIVNDADARMSESVIYKTVPEFLNDKTLGFTQHTTKTLNEQRGESYFTNLLAVYTDSLYQGHFLLSSILGCHPPLVGHSIFIRSHAIKQCGRVRTLRKAQQWLKSIGLQFLPVDQVGFSNLQAENRTEYWSENHVSEDFELMIHLYSLGFNGRYIAYPDCEFQEGITRYFDEEAGRHRKFALGAHELIFNPFQDMLGQGIFAPVFKLFLSCNIPSYYKIFLSAYLCSYTSGTVYIIVFTASAIVRIVDKESEINILSAFNPASVIVLNFLIYYILGFITFCICMIRINYINPNLLFKEYRKKWCGSLYIVLTQLRYGLVFQFLFYNVVTFTYYFLGSMDHMFARPNIVGATNKDSITISRLQALCDTINFNIGSWMIAFFIALLAYLTILQEENWDYTSIPNTTTKLIQHIIFAGPALFLSLLTFIVPILLNPWILGWPFLRKKRQAKTAKSKAASSTVVVNNQKVPSSHTKGSDTSPSNNINYKNGSDYNNKISKDLNNTPGSQKQVVLGSPGTNNSNNNKNNLTNVSNNTTTMTVDLGTLMKLNVVNSLSNEMHRAKYERDVEIGSVDIRTIGPLSATDIPSRTNNTSTRTTNGGGNGNNRNTNNNNKGSTQKSTRNNNNTNNKDTASTKVNGSNNNNKNGMQKFDAKHISLNDPTDKKKGVGSSSNERFIYDLDNGDDEEQEPPTNTGQQEQQKQQVQPNRTQSFDESYLSNRISDFLGLGSNSKKQQQQQAPTNTNTNYNKFNNESTDVSIHSKKSQAPVFVSAHAFSSPPIIKSGSIISQQQLINQQQDQIQELQQDLNNITHQQQQPPMFTTSSSSLVLQTPQKLSTKTQSNNSSSSPIERRWGRLTERTSKQQNQNKQLQNLSSPATAASTPTAPSPNSPSGTDKWGFPEIMDTLTY